MKKHIDKAPLKSEEIVNIINNLYVGKKLNISEPSFINRLNEIKFENDLKIKLFSKCIREIAKETKQHYSKESDEFICFQIDNNPKNIRQLLVNEYKIRNLLIDLKKLIGC